LYGGIRAAFAGTSSGVMYLASATFWGSQLLLAGWIIYIVFFSDGFANRKSSVIGRMGALFVIIYAPAMGFGVLLLGEDVFRILRALVMGFLHLIPGAPGHDMNIFEHRSAWFSRGALAFSVLLAGVILHGISLGKYRFKVHPLELRFKDLPPEFDGFKITQISDIHAGSFDNRRQVERAVDMINQQHSDVIFFTGDLVNNAASEMEPWIDVFGRLEAPMGKYSILGNHDYGDYLRWPSDAHKKANLESLFEVHRRIGFKLLRNENQRIEKNGAYIDLLGIENWGKSFAQYGDLTKTLENTIAGSFKILLSHDPTHWEEQVMNGDAHIPLTLSGHTHGMQFGFELFGFRFSPARLRYKRWAGLYETKKRFLYINRGFGFLGFPGRVGIWPEITVITLRKDSSKG
jgi:predicted MPP superfamily phosphohydrolase